MSRAWGGRLTVVFWVGVSLLLTACAGLLPVTGSVVDGTLVVERYQRDQAARREGFTHWGVEGILDMETPEQGRRNRIDLLGSGEERLRLRAFGPFQQVALEFLAGEQWIRWLDPQKHTVTQVPATVAGMEYLIQIPLVPARFFQMLMGRAGSLSPVSSALFGGEEGVAVETQDGERLYLDPLRGRVLKRSGEATSGRVYQVVYTWPEEAQSVMPARILVTLDNPRVRLEFILQRWYFPPAGPAPSLFEETILPGFSLSRPLDRLP
ncbi:MAG: hypothetical protein HQL93_06470 [Magnetococcales bacterium]|nr:hypothetical protein [Magnetococcales bacterium]